MSFRVKSHAGLFENIMFKNETQGEIMIWGNNSTVVVELFPFR